MCKEEVPKENFINEMKKLFNQITELRIQLILKELENKELKQKLNALYRKRGN